MKNTFSEKYRITSYLVNLRQRAGLYGILNLVQDVGWQHAIDLGFDLAGEGLAWVFTRQKLEMRRWPEWNDLVEIRTWLRPVADGSPFVFRDYELFVGAEKVGECTSSFTVIDTGTRKLGRPDWSKLDGVWRHDASLGHQPAKIPAEKEATDLAEFEVRNSDLDLNQHVNNTRYAQWVLDSLPIEALKTVDLMGYEINFLAETRKGDRITVQQGKDRLLFQGLRRADSKIVFTARLTTQP